MKNGSATTKVRANEARVANGRRIFDAWRELRRGPVRLLTRKLYGTGRDALDPAQVDSLEVIITQPRWRMSEFAGALHIDPSTATRMVNRLVAEGMVDRSVSLEDGRIVYISATPGAVRECARIKAGREKLIGEFLAEFTAEEIATLATLLEQLAAGVARVAAENR